jgi:pyruvate,water dikinase
MVVWDNSNIVESYPGITLPLTFSFIRRAYRAVYWQFCQVLGLSEREISGHEDMLSNMLGLLNGRVYYNLRNWYRLVALLPGFRFNKSFMEGMMGLREPADARPRPTGFFAKYFRELPRLVRSGLRAIWLQRTLPRRIRDFHRDFDAAHRRFAETDFESMSLEQLVGSYRAMERDILWKWKAPIINDFSAMIFYGTLKKLTVRWEVDADGSLQNALISRQGGVESTRVAEELWGVAELIAEDEALKEDFVSAPPAGAVDLLKRNGKASAALERYLSVYGDRCIAELKLESSSMRDDPTFCAAVLQNYLRSSRARPRPSDRSESLSPEEARAELARRLKGRFTMLLVPRPWVYRWVLKRAAAAVRNRENQRLARTRAFALVRRIFRNAGRVLAADGRLEDASDVFYLRVEEVEECADGRGSGDLRERVTRRRRLYERYRSLPPPPDHLETPGMIGPEEVIEVRAPEKREGGETLSGMGACPGVLERPAVVLLEPDTSLRLDGEILVTRQTDPGWVVLFPSVSGLVVERGGMLSHSAIVAREMGIPAVVGVAGATERIRSGDLLRIDGATGSVEVVRRAGGDS